MSVDIYSVPRISHPMPPTFGDIRAAAQVRGATFDAVLVEKLRGWLDELNRSVSTSSIDASVEWSLAEDANSPEQYEAHVRNTSDHLADIANRCLERQIAIRLLSGSIAATPAGT